jgi:hypothetical protein
MIRLSEHVSYLISLDYRVCPALLFRRDRVHVERCHKRPLQCFRGTNYMSIPALYAVQVL